MAKSKAEIVSDELQDNIKALEQDLINAILRLVGQGVSFEEGRVIQTEGNTKFLISLQKDLVMAFERAGYYTNVEDYLATFDDISQEVIDIHKEINDLEVSTRLLNPTKASFVDSTAQNLLTSGVDITFINPIKQNLFGNINSGGRLVDIERALRRTISGRLNRWAGQVARDASFQYQGQAHTLVKEQFELNGVLYQGTIVNDSRAQCRKWLDMRTLTDEQIKKEVQWALKKPNRTYTKDGKTYRVSGMIPNTTPETFLINRGGYNCRHQGIPISI